MHKLVKNILVIVLLVTVSCGQNIIISKDEMVPILVKIYLTDASIMSSDYRNKFYEKDSIEYYAPIIESFGYTSAQFDSSLKYYNRTPSDLDAIYDKVVFELSKLETELTKDTKEKQDSIESENSNNIWNQKPSYELTLDSPQDLIIFEIPVTGIGTYTLSYDLQIFSDDESLSPQLKIFFYYDDKTESGNISEFTTVQYEKDGTKREIKTKLELKNNLVTSIKGVVLDYSNPDRKFRSHATVSNIKLLYKPFIESKLKPKTSEATLKVE